ncbi:MAG: hypothetical protein WCG05_04915 [Alphaproteobacteria bacterium]
MKNIFTITILLLSFNLVEAAMDTAADAEARLSERPTLHRTDSTPHPRVWGEVERCMPDTLQQSASTVLTSAETEARRDLRASDGLGPRETTGSSYF